MPAPIEFIRDETVDQAELDAYSARVGASFEGRDVKFLATYGAFKTLERPPIEGAVVLELPDIDAARE